MENSTHLDHVIIRLRRKRFRELAQYMQVITRTDSESNVTSNGAGGVLSSIN